MLTIELEKIDEITDLTLKLKAVIYLRLLLNEELGHCSFENFSDIVRFADCYLVTKSADLVVRLMELVTDKDFTKEIKET